MNEAYARRTRKGQVVRRAFGHLYASRATPICRVAYYLISRVWSGNKSLNSAPQMTHALGRFKMSTTARTVTLTLANLILLSACKGDAEPVKVAPPAVAADPRPDVLAPGDACPEDGRWKPCTMLDRMERAGLVLKAVETDTIRLPYLTPAGLHYKVGKTGLLIAFYYQDSLQAKAEWAKLDTVALVPPGDTVTRWPAKPSSIRAANVIAAYFFANATQIERVRLLFEGGLPSPRP